MGTVKVTGIVLKETVYGENNKRVVVLSKKRGKLVLFARGAQRAKSKLLAGTQIFAYCDFLLDEKKDNYSISQIELLESFYEIRTDIKKLSYSVYFLELVEKTALEGMECDQALSLLLRTLWLLMKTEYTVELAAVIFELKFLQISGYMPEIYGCVNCQKSQSLFYFSQEAGGVLCKDCAPVIKDARAVSQGALKAMAFVLEKEIKNIFRFSVSEGVLLELQSIIRRYMKRHMNLDPKSLAFLENQKNIWN